MRRCSAPSYPPASESCGAKAQAAGLSLSRGWRQLAFDPPASLSPVSPEHTHYSSCTAHSQSARGRTGCSWPAYWCAHVRNYTYDRGVPRNLILMPGEDFDAGPSTDTFKCRPFCNISSTPQRCSAFGIRNTCLQTTYSPNSHHSKPNRSAIFLPPGILARMSLRRCASSDPLMPAARAHAAF
jgi:hypothetical protein